MRVFEQWYIIAICLPTVGWAEESELLHPEPVDLQARQIGDNWTEWAGIGDLEGVISHRERVTSLHLTSDANVWVGTSRGRVLRYAQDAWTLQATLSGSQITGIAVERPNVVWLSTSDGVCRLKQPEDTVQGATADWIPERFREYYQGHPSFVSGGYIPGEDAVRLWGHVDDIVLPRQISAYAPYVVSEEHGLFTWGAYHGVWHHFLPHYWGASSEWLDTRNLIPHRRPTCLTEDMNEHLWIGTDGDGIVRMNAHARRYNERKPENNGKDETEFSYFSSDEVGCDFVRVNDIAVGLKEGVWAALVGKDKRRYIGRYRLNEWSLFEMPKLERHSSRNQRIVETKWWEATPLSVAEFSPGHVLVGAEDAVGRTGLFRLDWRERRLEKVDEVKHPDRGIEHAKDGTVWLHTSWSVYRWSPK